MKRQAENQITKDGHDGGSDDEGIPEQGMNKASEAELGRRVIRPLPSRTKSSAAAFSAPTAPTTTSIFSNPSPFDSNPSSTGAASISSNASTFTGFSGFKTTTTNITAASTTSSTNNAFSSTTPSSSSSSFFKPSQPASSPQPAVTSTSKTFASLLSSSGPSPFGTPPSLASTSTVPTVSSPGKAQDDSAAVKYYKDLRGLNLSLISAITKSVEKDPYVDLADALEKYKSYRSKTQAEFDDASTTNGTSSPLPSTRTPPAPSTSKPAAMPAPPPAFAGFSGFKLPAPSTTSTSSESASTSSVASNSTGFKPTNSAFGSSSTPSPFSFPSESKESKAPGFSFGSSTSTPSLSSINAPSTITPSASFSFGSSSTSSSTPSTSLFGGPFGSTPSQPSTSASNPFGMTASQTATSFSFGKPAEKSTGKSETASSSNPFGIPEKSASSSFFSTSKPSTTSGFSFGSPSSTSVFGKTESVPPTALAEDHTTEGENSERGTPTAEGDNAPPALLSSNPLDEEGAGEENEETVHTIKAKAFKLSKDAEGAAKWLQLGTGMLRIKKDKETGARRVLLRNSTNGKVIVNFKIYSALKPTQNKVALSFIGHEDGAPQTYSIRLAKEEDAKTLKDALDREIAFVKAKETS